MLRRVCWQLAHCTCVLLPWLGFDLNAFTLLMRALLMILILLVMTSPPLRQPPPASYCTRRPYGVLFVFFVFFMYRMQYCCRGNSAALASNHTEHSNTGFSTDMSVPGTILMAVLSDQRSQKYSEMSQVWLLNQLMCVYNTTILSWSLLISSAKH